MTDHRAQLHADNAFRERLAAFAVSVPQDRLTPLDTIAGNLRAFGEIRRRETRIARLEAADRAEAAQFRLDGDRVGNGLIAFDQALRQLSDQATALSPLIGPALDEVIALGADPDHPFHRLMRDTLTGIGFTDEEFGWIFEELGNAGHRPVQLICAGGIDDLLVLIASVSRGENGVLLAGFPRFTGDAAIDERIEGIVSRARQQGVTANAFLVLIIVIAAHLVASRQHEAPPG